MNDELTVSITGMDAKSCRPSGQGALIEIPLDITTAPPGWDSMFNDFWAQHFYMMKRRAHASPNQIVITCMPNELDKTHIPELKKVIEETNKGYLDAKAKADRDEAQRKADEKKFGDDMDELADGLDL